MPSPLTSETSFASTPCVPLSAFLEHLVRSNVITEEIAVRANSRKKESNGKTRCSVLEVLQEEFGVSRDRLYREVAHFYSFRIVSIDEQSPRRLSPSAVNKMLSALPDTIYQLAVEHKVLPYELAENQQDKILVVTPNPSGREISNVARALPYKKFEICYMKEADWNDVWRQVSLDRQAGTPTVEPSPEELLEEQKTNRSQIIAMVDSFLLSYSMGQHQLLLIILGIIVVGLAGAAGITMFANNAISANRDAVIHDLVNLSSCAQQYYRRPLALGGGGGKFDNVTMKNLTNTTSATTSSNANGTYTMGAIVAGANGSVTINGKGTEKGNNGRAPVEVNVLVSATADSVWVVN